MLPAQNYVIVPVLDGGVMRRNEGSHDVRWRDLALWAVLYFFKLRYLNKHDPGGRPPHDSTWVLLYSSCVYSVAKLAVARVFSRIDFQ